MSAPRMSCSMTFPLRDKRESAATPPECSRFLSLCRSPAAVHANRSLLMDFECVRRIQSRVPPQLAAPRGPPEKLLISKIITSARCGAALIRSREQFETALLRRCQPELVSECAANIICHKDIANQFGRKLFVPTVDTIRSVRVHVWDRCSGRTKCLVIRAGKTSEEAN